jgi:hypothetical protein
MDMNPIENTDAYLNLFRNYLNAVKKVNGCLVIDFHQEHFQEKAVSGPGKVYRKIIDCIAKDKELSVLKMEEVFSAVEKTRKEFAANSRPI